MSEARVSIHDLPDGGIIVKYEQDFRDLVGEYAGLIQRDVDAAALDKAAATLAKFGYEKVVRCRDCKHFREKDGTCHAWQWVNHDWPIEVDPSDYCSYGERREQ